MIRKTTVPVPLRLPRCHTQDLNVDTLNSGAWLSVFDVRSSIRSKIVLAFVVVSILAISAVSIVSYFIAKNVVSDTVINGLHGVATHQAQQIETTLSHYREDVQVIAADTRVRQSLRHFIASSDFITGIVLNQILSDHARNDSVVQSLDLLDTYGAIVASSDTGHLGPADFDPTEPGIIISTETVDAVENRPTLRISTPVILDSRIIGYASAHLNGDIFEQVGSAYVGLRDTGETILVARSPNGEARFISPLRFSKDNAYYKPIDESDTRRIEFAALTGTSGQGTEFTDYRGHRVFGAYDFIEDSGIGVVVKMDEAEALSRLSGFIGMLALVIPVIIIGVVLSALLLARQLTGPIGKLTSSADDFSRGDLSSRVHVESTDEIGILADTFNSMAASLQTANLDLEHRVKERTADLNRSNYDLEQFAYVASHDLQEPLRMVTSYTQLLARRYRDQLDEDANKFIEFAVDGAKRMQILINDLLAYSRVGRHASDYTEVDTIDIVSDALKNLSSTIEEEGASISIGELPVINADRLQLVSLFQNLISNGIKYRDPDRHPWIEITAERIDSKWRFAVTDNGIGIDPAFSDRIFTIFQRLHSREKYQETGIGLAIARKIVERAGGSIWVDSVPGKGSIFFFTLVDQTLALNIEKPENKDDHSVAIAS